MVVIKMRNSVNILKNNNIEVDSFIPSFHTVDSHKAFVDTMLKSNIDNSKIYSDGIDNNKIYSVGAASSGIAFVSAMENGFIKSGDKIALCAYGSGVTSSIAVVNIK